MIPVYEPYLTGRELEYATDAVKSGWISSIGRYIPKFEEKFAAYCSTKSGASCSNGTTALHLALKALGIKAGDEVIVPNVTFIATANAVTYCNAKPVLVDIGGDWCINPDEIEKKITPKTRGIIPVHLYGQPADMKPILETASKHGLFVLEDCAEAHGAEYNGKKVGSFGDAAAFSFYGNKIITTGEGGMVVSNDTKITETVKLLRDHGMHKEKKYWHDIIGYNYRMTNIQAAIGLAQLENIQKILELKEKLVKTYNKLLTGTSIELQKNFPGRKKVNWLYTLLLPENISRDEVAGKLKRHGIDSRPFFRPLNSLPPYKSSEKFPRSNGISSRGITLPSSPHLKENDMHFVCEKLKDSL